MRETKVALIADAWLTRRRGRRALTDRQRMRLDDIVRFVRVSSPYYRELYSDLPGRVETTEILPVTDKKKLMGRFDDWVTDRRVTIDEVRAFVDDPALIGERFLEKYTVATTSGTTGVQGIFLIDDRSLAVTNALAIRMLSAWLGLRDVLSIVRQGRRMAMVNATGGHFASAVAARRLTRNGSKRVAVFSVRMPLEEMVAGLNEFRPALIAAYASMAALLASEQEAARLHVDPVLLVLSAEGLPASEYGRIATAFKAKVRDSYAATECPFLSFRCAHGWLHVNSDWVVLEPVDEDHRPVRPGEQSHTVLISNLANRVQPVLRYDLGDSVVLRPDPCPCGDPLPAVRVQGRAADVLAFPGDDGARVVLAPLTFSTIVDRVRGIELLQIIQTEPRTLRVRLRVAPGNEQAVAWKGVHDEIKQLLNDRHLRQVRIERAEEPPQQSPGGKYRQVIPLGA